MNSLDFNKIFTTAQIREADSFTIAHNPILSIDLMERAAIVCAEQLEKDFGTNKRFAIVCGQGNNGGDGLAIARLLAAKGNQQLIDVYFLALSAKTSEDCSINKERLSKVANVRIFEIGTNTDFKIEQAYDIVVDAILGTGLSKRIEGKLAQVITAINQLQNATIVAIDVPSGLFLDMPTPTNFPVIQADYTYSFQFPKLAFMFADNAEWVRDFKILPIGISEDYISQTVSKYFYLTEDALLHFRHKRKKFMHKGSFGHALLIAGSYGKMGAAVLASEACLRSGVGLLTTHLPTKGVDILQTSLPEAMVSIDAHDTEFSTLPLSIEPYTSVGIGPGIGTSAATQQAFFNLLNNCKKPMVIDADGLNILSINKEWLSLLPEGTIISPHLKEFERLAGKSTNGFERLQLQIEFSKTYQLVVILKGAHTSVCSPSGEIYFNSTGNPGMATAGSGDVLTGILTAYLAQGYAPLEAALLGVFDHGKAGDKAALDRSEQAMMASDIVKYL